MLGTIKIDEIYETEITSLENEGSGVCKINQMIVFVPKALPGEKVRIRITEKKKNFARGKIVEILKSSDKRIESKCPYYEECGGCNLRHQTSKENLKFKKEKVETALKRIGKLDVKVEDTIPSLKEDNYRNKVSFKVEDNRIGFYGEGTYQLIDIDYCLLAQKQINDSLNVIKNYLKENDNEIKNITIRYGNAMDELLIDIYSLNNTDIKILDYLTTNICNLKSIIFNDKVVYGNGYIKEISNGLMFNISAKSFFQVNSVQTEKLYDEIVKVANLSKDDVVLDLYCGTGTITSIVSKYVKKVIGIEIVEDAIIDAKENLKINGINNAKFICGAAAKEISKIKEKVDVVIVDPPRKGVDRKAIAIMKKISPKKIVYVSCNPVTMARDLSYLNDLYDVKKVTPVDMFPNTAHVESVVLLERK
ncbi:MAG: 23S rRNA (uracil(1939)-C(5))-methyltransferase RlmD [Candidatus Aphodocola sp.]